MSVSCPSVLCSLLRARTLTSLLLCLSSSLTTKLIDFYALYMTFVLPEDILTLLHLANTNFKIQFTYQKGSTLSSSAICHPTGSSVSLWVCFSRCTRNFEPGTFCVPSVCNSWNIRSVQLMLGIHRVCWECMIYMWIVLSKLCTHNFLVLFHSYSALTFCFMPHLIVYPQGILSTSVNLN